MLLAVPAAQSVHVRSVVASGVLVTRFPAPQVVQGVHDAAFWVVLKDCGPHVAQVRLTVALGVLVTYCPALQVVQAVQLPAAAAL